MTRLNGRDRILFLAAVLLGGTGGALNLYILIPVSLVILYTALSISPKFRRHELSFLFPLSLISCLPANLRLSAELAELFDLSYSVSVHRLVYFLLFLLVLISAEELILGMIGRIIWGNQEAIFFKDEDRDEPKMNGRYLKEITEDELFGQSDSRVSERSAGSFLQGEQGLSV